MMPAGSHVDVGCPEEPAGCLLATQVVLAASEYDILAIGAAVCSGAVV